MPKKKTGKRPKREPTAKRTKPDAETTADAPAPTPAPAPAAATSSEDSSDETTPTPAATKAAAAPAAAAPSEADAKLKEAVTTREEAKEVFVVSRCGGAFPGQREKTVIGEKSGAVFPQRHGTFVVDGTCFFVKTSSPSVSFPLLENEANVLEHLYSHSLQDLVPKSFALGHFKSTPATTALLVQAVEGHPVSVDDVSIPTVESAITAVTRINEAGVRHLDLKPQHLLVGCDEIVRVIDFGLSVIPKDPSKPSKTLHCFRGTPVWASLFHHLGFLEDPACDFQSLCFVFSQLSESELTDTSLSFSATSFDSSLFKVFRDKLLAVRAAQPSSPWLFCAQKICERRKSFPEKVDIDVLASTLRKTLRKPLSPSPSLSPSTERHSPPERFQPAKTKERQKLEITRSQSAAKPEVGASHQRPRTEASAPPADLNARMRRAINDGTAHGIESFVRENINRLFGQNFQSMVLHRGSEVDMFSSKSKATDSFLTNFSQGVQACSGKVVGNVCLENSEMFTFLGEVGFTPEPTFAEITSIEKLSQLDFKLSEQCASHPLWLAFASPPVVGAIFVVHLVRSEGFVGVQRPDFFQLLLESRKPFITVLAALGRLGTFLQPMKVSDYVPLEISASKAVFFARRFLSTASAFSPEDAAQFAAAEERLTATIKERAAIKAFASVPPAPPRHELFQDPKQPINIEWMRDVNEQFSKFLAELLKSFGHSTSVEEARRRVEQLKALAPASPPTRQSSVADVCRWLGSIGLSALEQAFTANHIDGIALFDLTEADLDKMGVVVGDKRRLLSVLRDLQQLTPILSKGKRPADRQPPSSPPLSAAAAPGSSDGAATSRAAQAPATAPAVERHPLFQDPKQPINIEWMRAVNEQIFLDDTITEEELQTWTSALRNQRVFTVGSLIKLSSASVIKDCGIPMLIADELYVQCHPEKR